MHLRASDAFLLLMRLYACEVVQTSAQNSVKCVHSADLSHHFTAMEHLGVFIQINKEHDQENFMCVTETLLLDTHKNCHGGFFFSINNIVKIEEEEKRKRVDVISSLTNTC